MAQLPMKNSAYTDAYYRATYSEQCAQVINATYDRVVAEYTDRYTLDAIYRLAAQDRITAAEATVDWYRRYDER